MPNPSGVRRLALPRFALAACAVLLPALAFDVAAAEALTLPDALARAAKYDPWRPAFVAREQAAQAALRQAGVRPHPTLGADLENFANTGDRSLLGRAETTLYYEQTWERGGKRKARTGVARAELAVARGRGAVRTLELFAEVQAAWVDALAAQARIPLAEERLLMAVRLEGEVARRVSASRDPRFAGEQARTAVAEARIARDQALEEARQTRAALAAFWGGTADFDLGSSALEQTEPTLLGPRPDTPDLALLAAERDLATERLRLERTSAVQDPTWRAGLRHFGDGHDVAVVIGASIPLGRYNSNRGNIERAQAERTASDADIAAARIDLEREVVRLVARRSATLSEIRRIEADMLPSAQRTVAMVRDDLGRGGDGSTPAEVAEVHKALIDIRARRIELLKGFHLDGVRLDRLTGRHGTLADRAQDR